MITACGRNFNSRG